MTDCARWHAAPILHTSPLIPPSTPLSPQLLRGIEVMRRAESRARDMRACLVQQAVEAERDAVGREREREEGAGARSLAVEMFLDKG